MSIFGEEKLGKVTMNFGGISLNSSFFDVYVEERQISLESNNFFSSPMLCVISKKV